MNIPANLFLANPLQGGEVAKLMEVYTSVRSFSESPEQRSVLQYLDAVLCNETEPYDEDELLRRLYRLNGTFRYHSVGYFRMQELLKRFQEKD